MRMWPPYPRHPSEERQWAEWVRMVRNVLELQRSRTPLVVKLALMVEV